MSLGFRVAVGAVAAGGEAAVAALQVVCGGEDQIRAVKVTILWAEFGLRVGSGIVVHGSIVS